METDHRSPTCGIREQSVLPSAINGATKMKMDPPSPLTNTTWFYRLLCASHLVIVLIWPVLQWLFAFDVLVQFLKMLYYWNDLYVSGVWTFLGHFGLYVLCMLFVATGPTGSHENLAAKT